MCLCLQIFVLQLDEDSIFRHRDERRVRTLDDDISSVAESSSTAEDAMAELNIISEEDSGGESEDSESGDAGANAGVCDTAEAIVIKTEESVRKAHEMENIVPSPEEKGTALEHRDEGLNEARRLEEENREVETAEKSGGSESSDEGDCLFPDTTIELQHVKGDK